MMKRIGICLVFAGIALGLLWPWYQLNFYGEEFAKLNFSNLRDGTAIHADVDLNKQNNKVRIRFLAYYQVDGKLPPVKLPVKVSINDPVGPFLTGRISFPTNGNFSGPEQPKVAGSNSLEFDVLNDGPHRVTLQLAPNPNPGQFSKPDIEKVIATVVANAPEVQEDYKVLSVVLALTGVYFIIRGRRRKSADNNNDKSSNKKWGRGQ
ncbi:MAG: hypothetical protein AAGF54_09095 [Pseudomonadota bacterium]